MSQLRSPTGNPWRLRRRISLRLETLEDRAGPTTFGLLGALSLESSLTLGAEGIDPATVNLVGPAAVSATANESWNLTSQAASWPAAESSGQTVVYLAAVQPLPGSDAATDARPADSQGGDSSLLTSPFDATQAAPPAPQGGGSSSTASPTHTTSDGGAAAASLGQSSHTSLTLPAQTVDVSFAPAANNVVVPANTATAGSGTSTVTNLAPIEGHSASQGPANVAHGPVLTAPPQLTPEQAARQQAATLQANRPTPPVPVDLSNPGFVGDYAPTLPTAANTPAPQDFVVYKSTANQPLGGGNFSTVGEPAVGSLGRATFETGNWYASVSGNYGSDFGYINPYNDGFYSTGDYRGGFCCDQRVASSSYGGSGLVAWYLQYVQTGSTSNDVGPAIIAVAPDAQHLVDNSWFYWGWNPRTEFNGVLGAGKWLDFPRLAVSSNYLYATSNVFLTTNGAYSTTIMWRMPLSALKAGQAFNYNYWYSNSNFFSAGLTQNATSVMYSASITGQNTIRVYDQPEANTNLNPHDISGLSNTYFNGFVSYYNGLNWAGRADTRIQTGFVAPVYNGPSSVWFMWNSSQGSGRPQPFVRMAAFNTSNFSISFQFDYWFTTGAWLYPGMAADARGHWAGTMFAGGGGNPQGGTAPQVNMLIYDDYSAGSIPNFFGAQGNNADNNLWGDYLSAEPQQRWNNTWVATGYIRTGTTVFPYYFWFGRDRDNPHRLPGTPHLGNTIGTSVNTGISGNTGSYNTTTALWEPRYGRLDRQIYRLQANAGTTLTALTSLPTNGDITDTILRLFDANGNQLAVDDDGGGPPYSRIVYQFQHTATYYVGVSGYANFNYSPFTAGTGTIGNQATYPSYGDYRLDLTLAGAAATTHFQVTTNAGNPQTAGAPFSVTVRALDATNNTAYGYRGTVHFTSNDGQAGLPADYAFADADAGAHTFTNQVTLRTAGVRNVTATDTVTSTINGTSPNITVVAAPGDHLDLSAPSSTTAGAPFGVTVTARDPYNNVATTYAGTVSFTSSDPHPATLPGPYTFIPGTDQGVHTFTNGVTLFTTPSQTVTVNGTGGVGSQTATVTVNPAALDHFAVTSSADGTGTVAGTPFDVTVTAQDAYGNTVTGYLGTVHFSSGDPYGATLPADYPFQPSDQGQAFFPGGATLYTAGVYDVTVTDTGSSATGSDFINVTAAPATSFVVLAPSTATSGTPFDITVEAVDLYGNIDTNYGGTVTFTTTDGDPGVVLPLDYTFQPGIDNGVVTFTDTGRGETTLITNGDQFITVTDTADGTITGTSNDIVVSGGPQTAGRPGLNPTLPQGTDSTASPAAGSATQLVTRHLTSGSALVTVQNLPSGKTAQTGRLLTTTRTQVLEAQRVDNVFANPAGEAAWLGI